MSRKEKIESVLGMAATFVMLYGLLQLSVIFA